MPRSIRSSTLETRSARLRLPLSVKPTFVRVADGKRGNWVRTIGAADDFAEADGGDVLNFWQAQDKVRSLARADRAATAEPITVAQALDAYEADLKTRGADVANVQRIHAHMTNGLAGKLITLLAARELRAWRDGLIARMSPASVNRTCFSLKAALNLAARQDERIISRRTWQEGLSLIPNATNDRNVILADGVVRDLIAEAYKDSREFGLFVELAAVTGARPSQIVRLEVRDLQDGGEPRLMMPASRKGKGKRAKSHYPVPISALRHSSIVRQLLAGVPVRIVAAGHDTSVAMIERNYSRYITDHADALVRGAMLDLTPRDKPKLAVIG